MISWWVLPVLIVIALGGLFVYAALTAEDQTDRRYDR